MGWPGLSVADDEMRIDPEVLEEAAGLLQLELDSLTGQAPGSLGHLSGNATVQPGAFGSWTTGQEMEHGYQAAYLSVAGQNGYYQSLIEQLGKAIGLLQATAAEQRGTDESAQQTFNTQNEALVATPDDTVAVA